MNVWVRLHVAGESSEPFSVSVSSNANVCDVVRAAKEHVEQKDLSLTARFDRKVLDLKQSAQNLNATKENPLYLFKGPHVVFLNRGGTNILTHGLPPVTFEGGRSSSRSAASSSHETAKHFKKDFKLLDTNRSGTEESTIWFRHNKKAKKTQMLTWSSETDLCDYVKLILEDVFEEADLDLTCKSELALFDAKRPHIWMVCAFGVPVGVVEVEKTISSKSSPLSDPKVLGQLFDYLSHLKAYAGRQFAFGILTTYNEWRIVWLPDADQEAAKTTITNELKRPTGPKGVLPSEPPNWDKLETTFPEEPTASEETKAEETRELSVTGIIQWNDLDLPRILLSVVHKMVSSPVIPTSISKLDPGRSYIYVTTDNWRWEKVSRETPLSIEGRVPQNFQNAFLLADLGGGGDGRVWLASTKDGKICVLKFSRDEHLAKLKSEEEVWKNAWSCEVMVKKLNGYHVLVMPWIKPCMEEEIKRPEVQEAVREAIQTLANAGYEHDDLYWRHVGLYKKDSKLKALLFDLARVTTVADKQARLDAVSRMMESLEINES